MKLRRHREHYISGEPAGRGECDRCNDGPRDLYRPACEAWDCTYNDDWDGSWRYCRSCIELDTVRHATSLRRAENRALAS